MQNAYAKFKRSKTTKLQLLVNQNYSAFFIMRNNPLGMLDIIDVSGQPIGPIFKGPVTDVSGQPTDLIFKNSP
jgi:hypothetical protein